MQNVFLIAGIVMAILNIFGGQTISWLLILGVAFFPYVVVILIVVLFYILTLIKDILGEDM